MCGIGPASVLCSQPLYRWFRAHGGGYANPRRGPIGALVHPLLPAHVMRGLLWSLNTYTSTHAPFTTVPHIPIVWYRYHGTMVLSGIASIEFYTQQSPLLSRVLVGGSRVVARAARLVARPR